MATFSSWGKAFRDLWENKTRALFVILALTVGVIGVGAVAVAYSILPREMDKNYLQTDPASATLWVTPVDESLVRETAALPQFAQAEGRSQINGRFLTGPGEWRALWLFVVPDFNDIKLDRFTPERGAWPPAAGEILLERTAVSVAEARLGDRVTVKIPGRPARPLTFSGTVHAPGLPPAWVESHVYGYITPETLALFGVPPTLNQLKILVARDMMDKAAIARAAGELKERLEAGGRTVTRITILEPGRHIHTDLMSAFLAMLGAMGLLAMVMSGVLVMNMISAMLGRQVRQIGIMKAMGGSAPQIAGIYLVMVMVLGITALAVGLPLSLMLGRTLAGLEAELMLNFEILDNGVAPWVYLLITGVGLVIPLLAAAWPVGRGTSITVLDALNDQGMGRKAFGTGRFDALLGRLNGGTRSMLLSLRNTFRRRGRLVLTLLTLSMGGASFMTAMNVRASVEKAVADKFAATPYDLLINFSRPYPSAQVERAVSRIPGVRHVETWAGVKAQTFMPDNELSGTYMNLLAPPAGSALTPLPELVAGRRLRPGDERALVASEGLLRKAGLDAAPGAEVLLDVNGRREQWRIVGLTREFVAGYAYAPFDYLTRETGSEAAIVVTLTDPAQADRVTRELEIGLEKAGFDVSVTWKTSETRRIIEDHMLIITAILLVMAVLFVIVGGLGLTTTMSLNVLDRTRELGVMRAIGAVTGNILRIIMLEGGTIGILGWALGLLFSLPLSVLMGRVIEVFLESPLTLNVAPGALIGWLLFIVASGAAVSAFPAWRASRRPVYEALSYE